MRDIVRAGTVPLSKSPVSQATRGGGFVFVGGQMPRDPATGLIPPDPADQAALTLDHALAVVEAGGGSAETVMLALVYMTDLSAKPVVDRAFAARFGDAPPARNLVEVSDIGEGAVVEVSLIALAKAPAPNG